MPTLRCADVAHLDILCVPGGYGVTPLLNDKPTIDFIQRIGARRELIISGGAINSPMLLLASGIGPAEQLEGVAVVGHPDRDGAAGLAEVSSGCIARRAVSRLRST